MKFGLREEIYNKIKKITQKYNYKFIIFGSRARGDYKNNSDIDIAIYGNITVEDEMKIRNDFDSELVKNFANDIQDNPCKILKKKLY